MADALDTTIDFLLNGDTEAKATLKDTKLLNLFKAFENMDEKDKGFVSERINALIFQR